jgi:predicted phosphodiesterase
VRYLILSDLHANVHALDAVLVDAAASGCDRTLCLGDLVGYGADPAAVVDRMFALEDVVFVRGNHDKVCAGLEPADTFNDVARRSIEWTRDVLTPDRLARIAGLPQGPRQVEDALEICHGAPFDEDFYVVDAADAARALDAARAPICLYGHTHVPAVFTAADAPAEPDPARPGVLQLPASGSALINVGSVGQPRDGDPRAAYGVLDLEAHTLELRRVAYDVRAAQRRILEEGLPTWLAERLRLGR